MRRFWIILRKEVYDNLRDKRSVFFAFLYGPVLLPLLMVGPIALGVKKHTIDFDKPKTVYVHGIERAPNLMQFLREENLESMPAPKNFQEQMSVGDIDLVIEVPEKYKGQLRAGDVATLVVYFDSSSDESQKLFRQVQAIVSKYGNQLAAYRMQVRGIDSSLLKPIHLAEEDLSAGAESEKFVARILPFIVILSLTMGGFYLAVDTTAGERERHSLEPLLSLSVSRFELVLGKYFAVFSFVWMSGLLSVTCTYVLFNLIKVDALAEILDVNIHAFVTVFLICIPLIFFFTSGMLTIATFARDTKEAQTHLGLAMMLPMAPFFVLQFMDVTSFDALLWVPILSQFVLIEKSLTGQGLPLQEVVLSFAGSVVLAILLLLLTLRLYQKDSILRN